MLPRLLTWLELLRYARETILTLYGHHCRLQRSKSFSGRFVAGRDALTESATFQAIFDDVYSSRNIYVTNVDADGSGSMNYYLN